MDRGPVAWAEGKEEGRRGSTEEGRSGGYRGKAGMSGAEEERLA